MKGFTCSNDLLKESRGLLSVVGAPMAAPRAVVDLDWADGELILSAYDGLMLVKIDLPCDCDKPGEAVVDARAWWGIIASLDPGGESQFKAHKTKATFTSGRTKASFRFHVGGQVVIDESKLSELFFMDAGALRKIFARILYAAGDDPPVNGVRLNFADGEIGVSATSRLALARSSFRSESIKGEGEYFVPKESVAIWKRVLPSEGEVVFHGDRAHLGLSWDHYRGVSSVFAQGFPDLSGIVVKRRETKNFVTLDKNRLQEILANCAQFVRDEHRQYFYLSTDEKNATIAAEGSEIGNLTVSLPSLDSAGGLDTHLGIDLILQAVAAVEGDRVVFAQGGPTELLFVEGIEDPGLGVVMPLVGTRKGKPVPEETGDF